MAGDLQRDGVKFCRSIFDTVRKMSADGLGVTRQGYSPTESEVLDYLKMIPRLWRAATPTACRRAATMTD